MNDENKKTEIKVTSCVCDTTTDSTLGKIVFRNGSENYTWICSICSKPIEAGKYISKITARRYRNLPDIPVIADYRTNAVEPLCGYKGCKAENIEYHHWAPKELFGSKEADKWPTSPLCPHHHNLWHNKMLRSNTSSAEIFRKRKKQGAQA